ncbi:MAG TPA: glutamate synthase subunit beta [Accumulibacter sp.]|uniref:glutamate synthase subunit beta n=1 Tax=Accumulibacter sp. TaxID=2053492 RepID=UPI002607A4B6|nr:glutamate synthase subunit beta [Accumulibacter sp.]HNN08515.1 glutamate synthase subunit beta [Azospira sp.]MDS4056278.1 glutamate synthase subunit beta [Accumulibacter sp.]HMV04054.1 glutamate synthase subunit beta [Accumulibacter sp.]HMW62630.1 glutamate synthase subunit beta [Accumulibacter sp.]HMW78903.1 glutamate synthase subunit beta [Accumulibacter sp.]
MGKPTGFIEYQRLAEAAEPSQSRLKHYREFVHVLNDEQARMQGARCMDCGIPFCSNSCPVNNIIPDWNDLVYRGNWEQALAVLHSTNNFPDFTGRICPAPCEAACTLNINTDAVGIKSIEHAIIDKGWEKGWIRPQLAKSKTGKKVAIVGSGPAGLAAAQQLARVGHTVVVFEKNDRIGGLLRYGIPDFKLEKSLIDLRIRQMEAEGVAFRVNQTVGGSGPGALPVATLLAEFDALVLAGGAEAPRDLPVPGRDLAGVHFAMDFLPQQNKVNAGDRLSGQIRATGKRVVVIGGGDTGSDCVGTSNRQGAASVVQFELMPQPPEQEDKSLTWPYWPLKLRTSSSHEEGCVRDFAVATREFIGKEGKLTGVRVVRVDWRDGRMSEVAGSQFELAADLVLLAMGFVSPVHHGLLEQIGVELDTRGNVKATSEGVGCYATNIAKVFTAGDMRRGQSLVVWAIREGRQCAREVDAFLMGSSTLPR